MECHLFHGSANIACVSGTGIHLGLHNTHIILENHLPNVQYYHGCKISFRCSCSGTSSTIEYMYEGACMFCGLLYAHK